MHRHVSTVHTLDSQFQDNVESIMTVNHVLNVDHTRLQGERIVKYVAMFQQEESSTGTQNSGYYMGGLHVSEIGGFSLLLSLLCQVAINKRVISHKHYERVYSPQQRMSSYWWFSLHTSYRFLFRTPTLLLHKHLWHWYTNIIIWYTYLSTKHYIQ